VVERVRGDTELGTPGAEVLVSAGAFVVVAELEVTWELVAEGELVVGKLVVGKLKASSMGSSLALVMAARSWGMGVVWTGAAMGVVAPDAT